LGCGDGGKIKPIGFKVSRGPGFERLVESERKKLGFSNQESPKRMFDSVIKFSVKKLVPLNPKTLEPFRVAFFSLLFVSVLLPRIANAQGLIQGISGLLEFNYSFFSSKTKDAAGVTTKTEANYYNPRFTLNIDTKIFPNLRLHAGGIAEGIKTDLKTDGTDTRTTVMKFRPYIDLTLETPLYTAGIGYIRRQERTEVSHSPSVTLVNDEYNAILGWRPEGLPHIEMRYRRTNSYDEDKDLRDTKEDYINLISRYVYKGLQVDYNGTYIHTMDDLNNLDVKQQLHNGRVSYSDSFFDSRVLLNTTYDVFYNQVKTVSEGTGFVTTQVFPFAGLSRVDNTLPPLPLALDPNPALVDGNTAASAGIDLVSDPPLVRRQMGLDFLNPTEVNQLLVWVDRELTSTIPGSFSWDVFISEDNLNWTHWAGPLAGSFGPFQNRFEINFPVIPARRYIKVVTTPLARSPLVPPNIFVTELQAFLSRPASDVAGKTKRVSHTYNLDGKVRILDSPLLFYDLYYFYNRVEPSSQQRYTLSNGFSANHRFSRVFSGTARVAREDGKEVDKKRVAYIYNASIVADPLRTLRNSLVFSGRDEEIDKKPNDTNSIFLYNTAQLYQGVDLNLNGGVNFTKRETGEKGRDILVSLGLNVVPHRTLILGLNYTDTMSRLRGGESGGSSRYTRRVDLNVNFNPVRTVYLSALIELIAEKGQGTEITQNYSVNWSPFPDGALQFNISYNENLRSEDRLKERIFTPSVRYKLSNRSYLDLTYQMIRSDSNIQKTESQVVSSSLKIFF
jgi:hypothetical protein